MVKAKTTKKEKVKSVVTRGKRKKAIARAVITSGKGIVKINDLTLDCMNIYLKNMILQPLEIAGDLANGLSISVNVRGGGMMSQADAARNAIARGIIKFTGNDELKEKYMKVDRFLVVEDHRRTEPKKYLGPKARARFQKSYR